MVKPEQARVGAADLLVLCSQAGDQSLSTSTVTAAVAACARTT